MRQEQPGGLLEAGPEAAGATVVIRMPLRRNLFLWAALAVGLPITSIPLATEGFIEFTKVRGGLTFTLVAGSLTVLCALLAMVLYRCTLTIGPRSFREEMTVWGSKEYEWKQVSPFYIRKDDEAVDAIGYTLRFGDDGTGKHLTGGQILMGSYPGTLQGLCDRLNRARDRALEGSNGES